MVKTGVVRRIDDLGRIVIPKEIRRTLGVHEGDPFEIMLEGKSIVLEKYSSLLNLEGLYDLYLETLYEVCGGGSLAICNREYVLMAKGCSISTENPISHELKEKIRAGKVWLCDPKEPLSVFSSGAFPIRNLFPVGPGDGRPMEGAILLLDNGKPYNDFQICHSLFTATLISRLLKKIEE